MIALPARLLAACLMLTLTGPLLAQDTTTPSEPKPMAKKKRILTPEEQREKEERKVCKVQICGVFRTKVAEGPDISCDITKTWREEDIEDMVTGGHIDWPWGGAKCKAKLNVKRALLAEAITADSYLAKLEPFTVACVLDRKSDGKTYDVDVEITPEVTFEKGKAVKAQMNWGDISAPMLAYGVIWPGAKLDNGVNVFGGTVVKMVNEFVTTKCDEVKGELPPATAPQQ